MVEKSVSGRRGLYWAVMHMVVFIFGKVTGEILTLIRSC